MLARLDRLDGHMLGDKVAKTLPAFLGREFGRCRISDRTELVEGLEGRLPEDDLARATRRSAALTAAGHTAIRITACESISPQTREPARHHGLRVLTNGWLLPEAS